MSRMAREPQLRPSLSEDDIPDDLKSLPKRCPRETCRSYHVTFRYFNNRKLTQPRFKCKACKELFTLGGGRYKKRKANRPDTGENSKQRPAKTEIGRNVEAGNRHLGAQAVETGKSSGAAPASLKAARLDLTGRRRPGRTTPTRPVSPPGAEFEFEAADAAVSSGSDASEQEEFEEVENAQSEEVDASSADDASAAGDGAIRNARQYWDAVMAEVDEELLTLRQKSRFCPGSTRRA